MWLEYGNHSLFYPYYTCTIFSLEKSGKDFQVMYEQFYCLFCLFFVLRHINLIGHLMPNQVKENKSEKKFKGEVLGINDKL